MVDNHDIAKIVEDFFSSYRLRRYAKGQVLILNGDQTAYVYHLVVGRVKQYDVTSNGEEVILNIFKPTAFFPMSLAINGTPNPYIYEAETEIEVHQVPAKEVVDFLKANPAVVFDLLARVYRGVDGLLGRMVQLMAGDARSRLLYELITETKRMGHKQKDGSYHLAVSEKDLGARTGLTRETVSRELKKLGVQSISKAGTRAILVKDLDSLEQQLHPQA